MQGSELGISFAYGHLMLPKLSLLPVAAALLLRATPAMACSQPQEGWQGYIPETHREGVPLSGLLLFETQLYLQSRSMEPSLAVRFVDVTVRDAQERALEGELRWDEQARQLQWQGVAPFAPNAQYLVEYAFRNQDLLEEVGGYRYGEDHVGSFTFRTIPQALGPVSAPSVISSVLTESEEIGTTACCDVPMENCVGFCGQATECQQCWALRYTYSPFVELQWNVETFENTDYLHYFVEQRGPGDEITALSQRSKSNGSQYNFSGKVDLLGGEFCARLVRIRATDDSRAQSEWTCIQESELSAIPRVDPPQPNTSECIEQPKKEELPNNGKLQTTNGAGCECVGAPPARIGLGLLLGLFALFALRGASSRDLS